MNEEKAGSAAAETGKVVTKGVLDVAVIGAGPAGSVAAERIAAAGWRVALLDKSEFPGKDAVCGGMVSPKDVEHFQVDPALIEKKIDQSIVYLPWGSVEMHLPGSAWNRVLTIQRKHFDRFLAEKAVRSGAQLLNNCRVTGVQRHATGRMTLAFSEKKQERKLESRLVIFADGPVTLARRCFGIGFEATPDRTAVSVICDFACPGNPMDHYEAYYVREATPPSFAWLFPFADHLNFGLLIPRYEMEKDPTLFNRVLDDLLQEYPPCASRLKGLELIRRRGAFLPMRPAERIHDDSCLVAGDAAGLVSPISGVGITFALHSGLAAAETAVAALQRGDFSAGFLSRYPREWHRSRKYRKLRLMDLIHRSFLTVKPLDPQALNKLLFVLNLLVTKAGEESPRVADLARVLLFPAAGSPGLKIVRTGGSSRKSPGSLLGKG